jgi:hypothetical protein
MLRKEMLRMCDFCENMGTEKKLQFRTTYADDNLCDLIRGDNIYSCDCEGCNGCMDENNQFSIYMKWSNYLNVAYFRKMTTLDNNELVIAPISEGIKIEYCPFCGKKLEDK